MYSEDHGLTKRLPAKVNASLPKGHKLPPFPDLKPYEDVHCATALDAHGKEVAPRHVFRVVPGGFASAPRLLRSPPGV